MVSGLEMKDLKIKYHPSMTFRECLNVRIHFSQGNEVEAKKKMSVPSQGTGNLVFL